MANEQKCCQPATAPTPLTIFNRPELSRIDYRVGTYGSFREAMLRSVAGDPALRKWTARSRDDYGIALLEMWAYLADILTFYQERYANEAFLGTARTRRALLRLAALLDYKPAPGLASSAYVAFTLEKGKQLEVPQKLLLQSVPGPGEKPQKFETVEAVQADARLNQLRVFQPKKDPASPLAKGGERGTLNPKKAAAIAAELAPGDRLVVIRADGTSVIGADGTSVEEKIVEGVKEIDWRQELSWSPPMQSGGSRMFKWRRKFRIFGHNAPKIFLNPIDDPDQPGEILWKRSTREYADPGYKVTTKRTLSLDAQYDDVRVGTQFLFLRSKKDQENPMATLLTIEEVTQAQETLPPLSQTVTRIKAGPANTNVGEFDRRSAVLYELVEPEVTFWDAEYAGKADGGLTGDSLYVRKAELGGAQLEKGRKVIVADGKGQAEPLTLQLVKDDLKIPGEPHVKLTFSSALSAALDPASAVLYGNAAKATHGETVSEEILGNGDASVPFQSFTLKKSPVTFVPDPTAPRGARSTLQVLVDAVRWNEKETLYAQGGDQRVFASRIDEESETTVQFGDGTTGARLTTGRNNVVATYRQGLGADGNVKAGTVTKLLSRPTGLKGVTNPARFLGGASPESEATLRQNAPNTVRTFNRIVSLRDFEDAAREYPGVAKARASWSGRVGSRDSGVFLVVAGKGGQSLVLKDIVDYLDARRDINQQLRLHLYDKESDAVPVRVKALIEVHPDYVKENVQKAAADALAQYFAFENRDFGQAVHLSDIFRVLQEAAGVVAVKVTALQFAKQKDRKSHAATEDPIQEHMRIEATELAVLDGEASVEVGRIGK